LRNKDGIVNHAKKETTCESGPMGLLHYRGRKNRRMNGRSVKKEKLYGRSDKVLCQEKIADPDKKKRRKTRH